MDAAPGRSPEAATTAAETAAETEKAETPEAPVEKISLKVSHARPVDTDSDIYTNARAQIISQIRNDLEHIDTSNLTQSEIETLNNDIEKNLHKLETTQLPLSEAEEPQFNKFSNLSLFGRGYIGREYPVVKSDNTNLKLAHQASLSFLYSLDGAMNNSGDFRLTEEAGLKLENKGTNHKIEATASAGLVADYNEQIISGFNIANIGTKYNAGINAACKPSDNVTFGMSAGISNVTMPAANTQGYSGNIFASVKHPATNTTITANAGINEQHRNLKLGFNEPIKNEQTLHFEIGARKNNTEVFAGMTNHRDRLNNTKNYNSVLVGVKVGF
jgi:hypothetical protein